jgi:hypothetical protein
MRGAEPISFLGAWRPMAKWYFSLWQEMLLPRSMHSSFGIEVFAQMN